MKLRLHRGWWLPAFYATLALGGVATMLGAIAAIVDGRMAGWLAPAVTAAALLALAAARRHPRVVDGDVRADEEGLWMGTVLVVPRAAVRHGVVRPEGDRFVVVLVGGTLTRDEVEVASEEEGREILAAIRLDQERSAGRFVLARGSFRGAFMPVFAYAIVQPLIVAIAVFGRWHSVLPTLVALAGFVVQMIRLTVFATVGADGVRLESWLARTRFYSFAEIARAELDGRNVRLHLRSGSIVRLHHGGPRAWGRGVPAFEEPRFFVERINAALGRPVPARDLGHFARGGRDTSRWLAELGEGSASYRVPSTPPEELWATVADPALPPTMRAGAAYVLRDGLDDEGRARLRVIADACASPRLRIVLEQTADEGEVDAAFDELEDEPRRTARQR